MATGPGVSEPAKRFSPFPAGVDIELTSRCNARCSFCPRDQTPHQGLIDDRTFTAALERAVEYRDALVELQRHEPGYFDTAGDTIWLSFCGMGEPLLHPRVVEYVERASAAGLRPIINTNAALLTPEVAGDLMDAGLRMACLNVGEVDDEYEAVYRLPFERTQANVEHFLAASKGRCGAAIVLVDHRDDPDHLAATREYWSQRGAESFMPFRLVNRAGALVVDEQVAAWDAYGEEAAKVLGERDGWSACWVPFVYPFIGYDGNYYLCSSDWRKEVDLGSVFERRLVDLLEDKAEQVCGASPICRDCTHEPTNAMAHALARAAEARPEDVHGDLAASVEVLMGGLDHFDGCLAAMRTHVPPAPAGRRPPNRRLIPVRS